MALKRDQVLGVVSTVPLYRQEKAFKVHRSLGRIVDELADRYRQVLFCVPTQDRFDDPSLDWRLDKENLTVLAQPNYGSSLGSLVHVFGIAKAYFQTCRRSDVLFVRGMLPYAFLLYLFAFMFRLRPCHWIVGNPIALLRTHKRSNAVMMALSVAYAWSDRIAIRIGRWMTGATLICNGSELTRAFESPKTLAVVSSTLGRDDFLDREDTCQGEELRILLVSFIRPEKGIEYLLEALSLLKSTKPWKLDLVGSWSQFVQYKAKLDKLVQDLKIAGRVEWAGFVGYGEDMDRHFRQADIFAFPSLSEGTPHVLAEAMANGLPIVTTNVGGIPDFMFDGRNAVVVEPKAPQAMADAIDRIIADGELRRSLIRNGLQSARDMTAESFADRVSELLDKDGRHS